MFWDNYVRLCQKKGKSPNAVARELSLSSGSVTNWKMGKLPHNSTLAKIAAYFDVSVELLLGKEQTAEDFEASGKSFVIFHRDGKKVTRYFTPEQMKMLEALVAAMPEADGDGGEGDGEES